MNFVWQLLCISGIVLLFLLAFAIFVLLIALTARIGINLTYNGKIGIIVKIWFVGIDVLKLSSSKKTKPPKLIHYTGESFGKLCTQKKKKKKSGAQKTSAMHETAKKAKQAEKKGALETVSFFKDLVSDSAIHFSSYAKLRIKRLYLVAAVKEDPAKTAVMFGNMNTALGVFLHVCERYAMFDTKNINAGVYSDFTADKPSCDIDIELSFFTWQALGTALTAFKTYLKNK